MKVDEVEQLEAVKEVLPRNPISDWNISSNNCCNSSKLSSPFSYFTQINQDVKHNNINIYKLNYMI